ncbi:MAG: hypothetical protein JNK65_04030 [Deltaproteobacteria bacterium]|nr:hypothetical protein [Deltaproteobacteria bacterium]
MSDFRVNPTPPQSPSVTEDASRAQNEAAQQNQQTLNEQNQKAQEASTKRAAQQLDLSQTSTFKLETPTLSLPQEFMNVIDTIVKEGYENAQPSSSGQTGDQASNGGTGQKNAAFEFQKDLQVIKEFMKEAGFLIGKQGVEVAQMLNMIKVEQGGAFWQKAQQVLQKGIPLEQAVLFQKLEKNLGGPSKNMSEQDMATKVMQAQSQQNEAMSMRTPGKAILEILKAETNPQQAELFLSAFQILNRDGLNESAQHLRSYLKRRSMPAYEQIHQWAQNHPKEIFQGPIAREPETLNHFWYILIALICFGLSMSVGLSVIESLMMGGTTILLVFLLGLVVKHFKK